MGRVLVIAGPTGVGKTDLAIRLAKRLGGELISCDSVQVYRELSVGANKWHPSEAAGDPAQHLTDLVSFRDAFTSADFYERCQAKIKEVLGRGSVPILVGGTGFYLEWLMRGRPAAPPTDPSVLRQVEDEMGADGSVWDTSLERLRAVDPQYAAQLLPNDYYRLKRALCVYRATGAPLSSFPRYPAALDGSIRWHAFYLTADREYLARRIDQRCLDMLRSGLLEEVWGLRNQGLQADCPAGRAIGYAETLAFFDQVTAMPVLGPLRECSEARRSLEQLVERFQGATRKYCRKQETWYAKRRDFTWIQRPTPFADFSDALLDQLTGCLREAHDSGYLKQQDELARLASRGDPRGTARRMRTYSSEASVDYALLDTVEMLIKS